MIVEITFVVVLLFNVGTSVMFEEDHIIGKDELSQGVTIKPEIFVLDEDQLIEESQVNEKGQLDRSVTEEIELEKESEVGDSEMDLNQREFLLVSQHSGSVEWAEMSKYSIHLLIAFMGYLWYRLVRFVEEVIGAPFCSYHLWQMCKPSFWWKLATDPSGVRIHRKPVRVSLFERTTKAEPQDHGSWKKKLNALSEKEFKILRSANSYERSAGEGVPSRSYYKLRDILDQAFPRFRSVKSFVDLCSGRGGWSQLILERFPDAEGLAVSFWGIHPSHEQWMASADVERIQSDYHEVPPREVDLVLFDGGESMRDPDDEVERFLRLIEERPYGLLSWLRKNPQADFVLKILTPGHEKVKDFIRKVQDVTGKGCLVRPRRCRYTNAECYLVSSSLQLNFEKWINSHYTVLIENMSLPFSRSANIRGDPAPRQEEPWEPLIHAGLEELPELPPLDTSPGYTLMHDLNPVDKPKPMHFLRETHKSTFGFPGVAGYKVNTYSTFLMRELVQEGIVPGFSSWSVTDTSARETFRVVTRKIDVPPVENHDHYNALLTIAKGMVKYLRGRGVRMRPLTTEEIYTTANRKSGMGIQERLLAGSMGEYLDSGIWRARKRNVSQDLLEGHTELGFFNSMGKKEKKKISGFKGSRLIWYLPATTRLVELENLGFFIEILKEFPFSVSGYPLYDYGELMDRALKGCERFLADDVAAWDTRISVGDLRIEHWMLQQLTKDERQKKLITALYRLYANKQVLIDREKDPDEAGPNQCVRSLFSLRGQRGSGENVTYAMNTITNAILTYYKVSRAKGIALENLEEWTYHTLRDQRNRLDRHEPQEWMTLISGDDSVIGVSEPLSSVLSRVSAEVHGGVGKPRKDIGVDVYSRVYEDMTSVPFCSHYFVPVRIGEAVRKMPVRSCGEILAKARVMLQYPTSLETEEAWARATGYQLLITYPHLLEVRLIGLALLSATRSTIRLEGLSKNPAFDVKPWLLGNTVIEVLNECLFGTATYFPSTNRISDFDQIQTIRPREYQGPVMGRLRKEWKLLLASRVRALCSLHGGLVEDDSYFRNVHPAWITDTEPKQGDMRWLEKMVLEGKVLRRLGMTF